MESLSKMSDAAIKANVDHYRSLSMEAANKAVEAQMQELKWQRVLDMKKNLRKTMENLLTST